MTPPLDALIIGAGPAGSAAARLLAAWGHRVLVVDKGDGESGRLAESIPPSAQKLLATIGALVAIEDAGFQPWRGNTVWWAGEPPRVETFPPGVAGYAVQRRAFDDLLRRLAADAGADLRAGLVRDVRVPGLTPASNESDAPADDVIRASGLGVASRSVASHAGGPAVSEATVDLGRGPERVTARFVLDCSGRAGVIARRGLRLFDAEGPRTVALAGFWRAGAGWPGIDDTHTLVASCEDGWAWSVPTSRDTRCITVMVDPARTDLARGVPAADVYRRSLDRVRPFAPLTARGELVDGPWGADATPYTARRYAGSDWLLAGDAGSLIDPLSSFGVKKALASGWLAAVAVHTALTNPAMRDEALAFVDRRERALAAGAARTSARFAAEAATRTSHPFWLARADAPAGEDEDRPDPAALAADPAVQAAFENLRRRPALALHATAEARIARCAAVRGREIVLEEQLVLPDWPEGVRYLRNVNLVTLLRLAPAHDDVGRLYEAYATSHPAPPLPDFLGALSVLIAKGGLRHEG